MFQNTLSAVRNNPALLQPLIQQLARTNPEVAQQLGEHPELLFQILGGLGGGDFDEDDGEGGEGGIPPGAQVLSVTAEERAAIERVS